VDKVELNFKTAVVLKYGHSAGGNLEMQLDDTIQQNTHGVSFSRSTDTIIDNLLFIRLKNVIEFTVSPNPRKYWYQ